MSPLGLRPRERVRRVAGPAELAHAAAELVLVHAAEALAQRGVFHLALSGGTTPLGAYRELASGASGLERWHAWFGDERCVPPDHADSNFHAAAESGLLARLDPARVHRVRGEDDPREEAERYARELVAAVGDPPRLDLALLGLGADGHTASLFPGAPEPGGWVAPALAPEGAPVPRRVTLTLATLARARALVFLVAGAEKSAALAAALDDSATPPLPARRAYPLEGELTWLAELSALRATSATPSGETERDRA